MKSSSRIGPSPPWRWPSSPRPPAASRSCRPGPRAGSRWPARPPSTTASTTSAARSTSRRSRRPFPSTSPPTTATSSSSTARASPGGRPGVTSTIGATRRWTSRHISRRAATSWPRSCGTSACTRRRPRSRTRRAFSCKPRAKPRRPWAPIANWKAIRNDAYAPVPIVPAEIYNRYYVAGPGDRVDAATYPWGWEQPDFDDSQVGGRPAGTGRAACAMPSTHPAAGCSSRAPSPRWKRRRFASRGRGAPPV